MYHIMINPYHRINNLSDNVSGHTSYTHANTQSKLMNPAFPREAKEASTTGNYYISLSVAIILLYKLLDIIIMDLAFISVNTLWPKANFLKQKGISNSVYYEEYTFPIIFMERKF